GEQAELPARTTSYKTWAAYLLRHAATAQITAQRAYWEAQFDDAQADLPRDRIVAGGIQADSASCRITFDAETTRRLLQECGNAYRTRTEDLLITALVRVLCQWGRQPSVLIELEGHGREPFDDTETIDLTRTAGWFTSLYPLCLRTEAEVGATIKSVKERLRRVPQRGMGWGVLKYLGEESCRTALQALPRPRVTFNYLGQFDASLTDNAIFRLGVENRGNEQSVDAPLANWLEINSQVYGGALQMTWTYSKSMYRSETVEQLAHRYRDELNALIEHCTSGVSGVTPADFPLANLEQAALERLPVEASVVEDIYPLSPMQQGMLFHSLDPAQAGLYVSQFDIAIDGLEPARFRAAWHEVVARHAILRTGFAWRDSDHPLQIVHRSAGLAITEQDLRDDVDPSVRLQALADDELARGFALDTPPLMRIVLAQTAAGRYRMVWTCHHLLLDGWSSARLLNEVLQRYGGHPLNALPGSYRDYIAWLSRQQPGAAERYWRARLALLAEEERTLLAGVLPQTATAATADYGLYQHRLPDQLARQLAAAAQACQVTLNTIIQAAWALLLQRYTGQRTVVFGATVAGRPSAIDGVEELLGLFINTIPLVLTPQPAQRCVEFLQAIQTENASAREFEHTPLFDIQRWAGMPGQSLFDTLLVFENYPIDRALAELGADAGLRFTVNRSVEHTNFPLTLAIVAEAGVEIRYGYQCAVFSEVAVMRIAAHVERLLQYLVAHPHNRLADIGMLSTAEEAVMARINAQSITYVDTPVYELIRAQALTQPGAPAVMDQQMTLTFGELETRSDQLAAVLYGRMTERNAVVGIYLERSPLFFVAALAVHKAGAAFLPLDPVQPADRIRELIADSGVRCVIGSRSLQNEIAALTDVPWIAMDSIDPAEIPEAAVPQPQIHPHQLAYIIYTSGSTGKPKGVAVTHGALSRHIQAAGEAYRFNPADCALHFASFSFDAAIEQWMAPLAYGASVVVGDPHWDGAAIAETVTRLPVTVIYPPTTHLLHLADAVAQLPQPLPFRLRICTVGGEAVAGAAIDRVRAVLQPDTIINGYGPTETVITPLAWMVGKSGVECAAAYAPIGLPLGERSVHILDPDLNPVVPGMAGELYIGGPCLARGYQHRPGLTAERFVPDPWGAAGARLYRTGDRVRLGADGVIEYLGRNDQQIKLRGYRIEPGEIEAALLEQPEVSEAIVVLQADQRSPRLIAYVACGQMDAEPVSADALKDRLRDRLPGYMVPAQIVLLSVLPRTRHGKVDRAALSAPLLEPRFEAKRLPSDGHERILAEVWRAVLGLEQIGVDENFFELGGDSIIAIQIVSRARQSGLIINPRDLFKHQTIEALARVAQTAPAALPVEQTPVSGDVPLTPIQMEFFATAIPNRHHWNQALLLTARTALEPMQLSHALEWLTAQHDALRLRYYQDGSSWGQRYVAPEAAGDSSLLWVRDIASTAEIEACAEAAQQSLDLQSGPLLRAVYFRIEGGHYRLLLILHHLIVDGVSWRILLEDLQAAYARFCGNQEPDVPLKTTSFQTWSRQLRNYAGSVDLQAEARYWETVCADIGAAFPADNPGGSARTSDYASHALHFDREQTRRLLQDAGKAYRTRIDELLLVALARVLCRWSGRDTVHVELEGHGREAIFEAVDLTRTVGWFTTTYPARLTPSESLSASIKTIKEQLRSIPRRGLGFGVLKYCSDSEAGTRLRQLPQPPVTFNYLGQFDASFDAETSLFVPATESCGADRDADAPLGNALELSGQVYGGELVLTWSYSRARYHAASIEKLSLDYRKELESIIEHCLSGVSGVTPSDYPLAGLTQDEIDRMTLPFDRIADLYPLSPLQQGLFYHALHEPEAGYYVNQLAIDVAGLDAERFKAAWQATVGHHAILRTGFIWEGGLRQPLQAVFKTVDCRITVEDRAAKVSDDDLVELQRADHRRGFDLSDPPLMRLRLIKTGDRRYHLIWTCHHLLLDGWSGARFIEAVLARYAGAADAGSPGYAYRDYIAWLLERDRESDARYWRAQLETLKAPTLLADALVKPDQTAGYGERRYRLSATLTDQLRTLVQTQRLTLNTLVQGAWALLLRRYTGQDVVAFGATVAGRPPELPGVEHILGLFINTIPIIQRIRPDRRICDWLRALQAHNLNLREYEYTPLHEIQGWADLGGAALFDTLLVFENYPMSAALTDTEGELRFSAAIQKEPTHYGLTLTVEGQESLEFEYGYARASFDENAIAAIHQALETMLGALAERYDGFIGQLADALHDPVAAIPCWPQHGRDALTIPQLIARQVEKQPAARALMSGGSALSYAEMDHATDVLARCLLRLGVTRETPVGACVTHGAGVVLAALGIWKAGGVYVPIDAQYPEERLRLMIKTTGLQFMITDADTQQQLPEALPVTFVPLMPGDQPDKTANLPDIAPDPAQLAYLIFTSGSTGLPKAVAVTHHALNAHCQAMAEILAMDADECALQFSSSSFDAALEQWIVPLLRGATVVMRDAQLWSAEQTLDAIARHGITRLDFPPGYANEVALAAQARGFKLSLRSLTVGGEALSQAVLARIQDHLQPQKLFNAYGPTEAAITPLVWEVGTCNTAYAPLGKAVGARAAYVLDSNLHPAPAGVAGELYIGGDLLARGYYRQARLTAERFIPDPFSDRGGRLYRTGDICRHTVEGELEFLGRGDEQTKIRGYRIELGEVETALLGCAGVREAVAVTRDAGSHAELIAYVSGDHLDPQAIRTQLQALLPGFMMPSSLIALDSFPRTVSGKIDRRRLPKPESGAIDVEPPRGEIERRLAEIWVEVLSLERIGRHDHFFELGGHSLLAVRAVSLINARLNQPVSIAALLAAPTVARLARYLEESAESHESLLIALNQVDTPVAPLFCLHPAGGHVFSYYALAQQLAGQRPVYGIQCQRLIDPAHREISLTAMAATYLKLIQVRQPEGPYVLLGWSLGGALAMEIARQLETAGETVAFLGLIDSYVAELDNDAHADDEINAELAAEVLRKLQACDVTGQFGTELITHNQEVFAYLSELARHWKAASLRVIPHCWWSAESGEDTARMAQALLEQAIGHPAHWVAQLPHSHSDIVHAPEVIDHIAGLLDRVVDSSGDGEASKCS
ncbi:MAG: amino acid adenylation domain-containing protein, partial [Nitrosomonas sp.]|nr:amino acid adenylation domain-containing protein [Nitrosomonas sp.]